MPAIRIPAAILATATLVAAADPAPPPPDEQAAWIHAEATVGGQTLPLSLLVADGKVERARLGGGMGICDPAGLVASANGIAGQMIVGFRNADITTVQVPIAWRTPIALSLTWEGDRVAGTVRGRFAVNPKARGLPEAESEGQVAGRRSAGAALAAAQGLAADAAWPGYLGPDQSFAARKGARPWLADPSQGRLAWFSQYIGPTESGSRRYGPCVGAPPCAGGASPVVAYGRVYQFRYVASGDAYDKPHVDAMLAGTAKGAAGTREKMAAYGWSEEDLRNRWRISADEELLCLDAATGRTLWTALWPDEGIHFYDHKCSLTNWTPAVADGTVFVLGGTGRLRAVDAATGAVRWQMAVPGLSDQLGKLKADALKAQQLSAPTRSFCHAVATAPGLVLVPDALGACGIVAVDAATGAVRWRAPRMLPNATAVPLVYRLPGRTLVVGVGDGEMTAIDAADGKPAWSSSDVGQNEYQCIAIGDRLIAQAMPAAARKAEIAAFPEEKRAEWAPDAVASAPGENFGQIGCWRIGADGATRLWTAPAELGAPWYNPIGAAAGDLLCTRGRYRYHILRVDDGSRIASSPLSEPARWDEGILFAAPGIFYLQPDSQHGSAKLFPFPARPDAKIAPAWHPPFPAATTYQVGMSHAWADGRLFIRGHDALYCWDLRGAE